jgi:hypothetical protein
VVCPSRTLDSARLSVIQPPPPPPPPPTKNSSLPYVHYSAYVRCMQSIARHFRQLLPLRHFASRSAEVPQSCEFRIALHNAPAVNLKGRQPWAAVHCSDGITNIALCGESSSLATLHFNGAVRLWSLDGEVGCSIASQFCGACSSPVA